MLFIRKTAHLLSALDAKHNDLMGVIEDTDRYYEELLLHDPQKPDKVRKVVNVTGELRKFQSRLYRRLLLPKLTPSVHSHGGVRSRSIKTNAEPHAYNQYIFKADITNFYPSIHHSRVYDLFTEKFECSPDVARICTRLCTYRHHLALGLITSPILADQVLARIDRRIGGFCKANKLAYTRYVDDITVSGAYDLKQTSFTSLIARILDQDGFVANPEKYNYAEAGDGTAIAGIVPLNGKLDVRAAYLTEFLRQLDDADRLARNEEFVGPYYTRNQLYGRARFVAWVNPRRRRQLLGKCRAIDWKSVQKNASQRGYVESRKRLSRPNQDEQRP